MFESTWQKAKNSIFSKHWIVNRIYREEKRDRISKAEHKLNKLFHEMSEGINEGAVDEVSKAATEIEGDFKKEFNHAIGAEKDILMVDFKDFDELRKDVQNFNKGIEKINEFLAQNADKHKRAEAKKKLTEIAYFFNDELKRTGDELLALSRSARDAVENKERLRDKLSTVGDELAENLLQRLKSRKIRRVMKKEERVEEEERKLLHSISIIVLTGAKNHEHKNKYLKTLLTMIDNLHSDVKKEDGYVKDMVKVTRFLFKSALMHIFLTLEDEGKLDAYFAKLKEMKFPEEYLSPLEQEEQQIESQEHSELIKVMREAYQLYHEEKGVHAAVA